MAKSQVKTYLAGAAGAAVNSSLAAGDLTAVSVNKGVITAHLASGGTATVNGDVKLKGIIGDIDAPRSNVKNIVIGVAIASFLALGAKMFIEGESHLAATPLTLWLQALRDAEVAVETLKAQYRVLSQRRAKMLAEENAKAEQKAPPSSMSTPAQENATSLPREPQTPALGRP